ncbi:MAG: galactonate dehydratase [Bryobacterales bacterium]|nr:galactonate dehydratase [Bryobacteraceae bacterium]MDW8353403.1 galactonate dehydratase [Bryobacterales bacterium]
MRITDVRTVVVNAGMRNWVFVKVETDEPGLFGWGEASLEWKTRAVVGAVEDLKPFVVGEDPTRIEHVYQKMYRQPFFRPGIIGQSAISGIEQACWDITGKWLGLPVYKLLGGAVRDKVRMYTHLGGGEMKAVYESFDPGRLVDLAQEVVARGYSAVKVVCVPYSQPLMNPATVKQFARAIGRLREALGEGVDIMVDFHGRTWPAVAIAYIRAIEEYQPYFCEEPVPPENVDALAEVRRAVRVPIATGERLVGRHQFREVFEKQAAHVIQPDLCHCGGLLEAKKIAAMAEAYYVGVAPHNPLGPVANAAALHFALSTPNFLIQEDMLTDVPWRWDVVDSALRTEKGYWLPVDRPGLGVAVNEAAAARHPFVQEPLQSAVFAPDGAVLDW